MGKAYKPRWPQYKASATGGVFQFVHKRRTIAFTILTSKLPIDKTKDPSTYPLQSTRPCWSQDTISPHSQSFKYKWKKKPQTQDYFSFSCRSNPSQFLRMKNSYHLKKVLSECYTNSAHNSAKDHWEWRAKAQLCHWRL